MRMFQPILLAGTEMASEAHRKLYGLLTRFRTIPGCIGDYEIFGEKHAIGEIEEIIVGSGTLDREAYIDCRLMNLIIQTFYNSIFEEAFSMVRAIGASVFDCLLYVKQHPELYSPRVRQITDEFVSETTDGLFDTFEQANDYVLTPEIFERYLGGELGTNELLKHQALLFSEFGDVSQLLFTSIKGSLAKRNWLSQDIVHYLDDLERFTVLRKMDLFDNAEAVNSATFDYDFDAIRDADYLIDSNSYPPSRTPIGFDFFHDEAQQKHIANQVRVYSNTPGGLGRLIQRSNLKLMFRDFAKSC